ncbi:hypothetical protein ACIP39_19695 [Streptomyces tibetensis]|uniref:hypothetical protein n=1 Tax=Streptomyces tibetensis TaxID=2382123 RepID=UPI0038055571
MSVYTPSDFVARLANGELAEGEATEPVEVKGVEGLEVVGVVKCLEDSSTLIGFSRALSCPHIDWIPLPIEMLESITHLRFLVCDEVEYAAVRVKFKNPVDQRPDVAFLLRLCSQLKSSAAHALKLSDKSLSRQRFDRELVEGCEILEFDGEVYICCDGDCGGLV